MVDYVFDRLLADGIRKGKLPARNQEARDWFRDQAKALGRMDANKLIRSEGVEHVNKPLMGNMYLYHYDPKHKATLPYWDSFPLVFPFNKAKGGFLGINLHYLPLELRANLMDALYENMNNKKYDESTKLKINYGILTAMSQSDLVKPTIKHYLSNHIRTRPILINVNQWDIALFMSVQKFNKGTSREVWRDSRRIIRGK